VFFVVEGKKKGEVEEERGVGRGGCGGWRVVGRKGNEEEEEEVVVVQEEVLSWQRRMCSWVQQSVRIGGAEGENWCELVWSWRRGRGMRGREK
jgi:hypothetical protein